MNLKGSMHTMGATLAAALVLGASPGHTLEVARRPVARQETSGQNTVRMDAVGRDAARKSLASIESLKIAQERKKNAASALRKRANRVTQEQREAAAARLAAKRAKAGLTGKTTMGGAISTGQMTLSGGPTANAMVMPGTDLVPHYFTKANWAFSPPLTKFIDTLPGLGAGKPNNLGQYLSVAAPDTTTYPGSDYYEIAVVQYKEQMHSELMPTTLRGYVQIATSVVPGIGFPLTYPDGSPIRDNAGNAVYAVDKPHYLGPVIVAQKNRPVRLKFSNYLPTGEGGNLFIPVDKTVMGAGHGPVQMTDANGVPMTNPDGSPMMEMYTENRATVHLHGGLSPWISDGTPHQWIVPAGEDTPYKKGASVQNVPDMPDPGSGSQTYYWTNQQSARFMFYHDHAYGITRLNVYAGEAAGFVIEDETEQQLIADGLIPSEQIPLVIQDKTFVDPATIMDTDPTWRWGSMTKGDLWMSHVYSPAQNPYDLSGMNAFGRWHYGPWFWPPTTGITHGPVDNPYYLPGPNGEPAGYDGEPPIMPGVPNVSMGMEAYQDTMVVNGTAFPTLTVDPKPVRFRILNAGNDRFLNLQLYEAASIITAINVETPGEGYREGRVRVAISDPTGTGATARAILNAQGGVDSIEVLTVGSGYSLTPTVQIIGVGYGSGATATATVYAAPTEVGMVPAVPNPEFPELWPTDGREGGVPDPYTAGPDWVQIGTEGGFLPMPVVIPAQPVTWNLDPTTFTMGNVQDHSLLLGNAERADVIVDFSAWAGKTLILYNDAPTAFPALDPRTDYYTNAPNMEDTGGHWGPQAGFGPNTRTVMQIRVKAATPSAPFNLAALNAAFTDTPETPGVFKSSQNPIIVGQAAYNDAYSGANFSATWPDWGYSNIQSTNLTFKTFDGTSLTVPFQPKAIQDEMGEAFDTEYGRMSGFLGVELPNTNSQNQNFVLQAYMDPPTEAVQTSMTPLSPVENGTQIWKITHNGVDTHPIHFHLMDVQLLNRVGWDGAIYPPDANELGWKETVRVSPLMDTIVAMRPVQPLVPFGVPDSVRLLDPTMPIGSTMGFSNIDPLTGQPLNPPTTNVFFNFNWEYMWHCHILSHEEMDMMRSIVAIVETTSPEASVLALATEGSPVNLTWNDPTPAGDPATPGNPRGEIGYRIERAPVSYFGIVGAYAEIARALANATSYTDATVDPVADRYSYRVVAWNASGETASNTVIVGPPASLDNLAPVSVATVTPTANAAGWLTQDATVNIAATDAESGVASLTYSLDGVTTTLAAAAAIIPVTGEGSHALSFYATDNAGNSETPQTLTIEIDQTAPTVVGTREPNTNGAWNNTDVTVTFTATDATSGVNPDTVTDTIIVATEGENQSVTGYATDNAGNTGSVTVGGIRIDKTAPAVTAVTNPLNARVRPGRTTRVTVSGTATDALSGIVRGSGVYTVTNSTGVVASGTFSVTNNGTYSFRVTLSLSTAEAYEIKTFVNDRANNTGSATATFVVH